MQHIQLSG